MLIERGDTGPLVQMLQARLRQLGYLPAEEPEFGAVTEAAVREFQRSQGLSIDGIVGLHTLARLFPLIRPTREYLDGVLYGGTAVFDDLDEVVAAVAAGEGGAFDALQLNGDGEGLSFGILQWAQKPGSLYALLLACYQANGGKFTQILGSGNQEVARELLAKTQGGGKQLALWQGEWARRFWLAGRDPELQRVQRRLARLQLMDRLEEGYRLYPARFKPAGGIARRALVMMADVGNQAGPGGLRRALQYAADLGDEAAFIRALGQYVENIISRKYGDPNYGNTRERHLVICRNYSLARLDWPALKAKIALEDPQPQLPSTAVS